MSKRPIRKEVRLMLDSVCLERLLMIAKSRDVDASSILEELIKRYV